MSEAYCSDPACVEGQVLAERGFEDGRRCYAADVWEPCPECNPDRLDPFDWVERYVGSEDVWEECPDCAGQGCPACHGDGATLEHIEYRDGRAWI